MITKKLARIESQFTLRRLVARARYALTRDIKREPISQLDAECLRDTLLDRQLLSAVGEPLSSDDLVMRRRLGRVGQIELAINQALGTIIGIGLRADRTAVDLDQSAADHRVQRRVEPRRAEPRRSRAPGLAGR